MSQQANCAIAVIGIDIGKNSFHVVGHDQRGAIVLRQKWSRGQVEARLSNLPPCLIGMEACVGAHRYRANDLVMRLCRSPHGRFLPRQGPMLKESGRACNPDRPARGAGAGSAASVFRWLELLRGGHLRKPVAPVPASDWMICACDKMPFPFLINSKGRKLTIAPASEVCCI
jgi:hypothetical protein